MATQCGHVFHEACLKRAWQLGAKPIGWCPFTCLNHLLMNVEPDNAVTEIMGQVAVADLAELEDAGGEEAQGEAADAAPMIM